ncbi:MAG: hypothetical protein ACIAQZ_12285 [Sedimentisphaeraceae bacterium JB056]
MTIEDWQNRPQQCKRILLGQIRDRLSMSTHPCSDCSSDANCPCSDICAYKQHFDEFKRVKDLSAEELASEQIALLEQEILDAQQELTDGD